MVMKKVSFIFLFAAFFLILLSLSVLADTQFVDPIEDGFPKAYAHSDHMYYQYNDDMECSILVKQSDTGSPSTAEYIVYKLDSEITGFLLDCMHVNGLGNGETDIKVYLSADNTKWTEVPVKATKQFFDEDVYIDFDHAYWLNSTVSNKTAVPAGNTFIKIEIQPFTVPESCTWNTVIDTVTITAKDVIKEGEPAESAASKPESSVLAEESDVSEELHSTVTTSSEDDAKSKTDTAHNGLVVMFIVIGVLFLVATAVAITVVLRMEKSSVPETEADNNKEE